MSSNRKNQSSSIWGKIAIGVVGVVGGLLLGKALDEAIKKQEASTPPQKTENSKPKRVESGEYTKNIEDYDTIQQLMTCPITNCLMKDPVIISQCGHTFQKQQILRWVQQKGFCPLCNTKTNSASLRPNYQLKQIIAQYLRNRKVQRQGKQGEKKQQAGDRCKNNEQKKEQQPN